jgi:hypothetical protein
MRHCVWQCLLRNASGESWAWWWAWAHEIGDVSPDYQDTLIDLHNNRVGRLLGAHLGGTWYVPAPVAALHLCAAAWNRGLLWTRVNGRIVWSDGRRVTAPSPEW